MLKCMFWNQRGKDLSEITALAVKRLRIDILITCENYADHRATGRALAQVDTFQYITGRITERFRLFVRFGKQYVTLRNEAERYIILDVKLPARERFLLMILHAPSKKAGWDSVSLGIELTHYAAALRRLQEELDLAHAVVVGDFNINPFEPGLVAATAFNAVMDARQARKGFRTVQAHRYSYFYNPMWSLLGDQTPGPPASLFYDASTQMEQQWHLLDQVIVSSSMIDYLDHTSIRILDEIGDVALTTKSGRPNESKYSDHLPLYFELKL